ncbi:MAG: TrbI/VirB10 family protein [Brevundimonas sp.]|uniref:TrbI/VirB10 family protein n=1 Tax=Brevundimonas sp. TaxID=1871086 RepID=UPI00391B9182
MTGEAQRHERPKAPPTGLDLRAPRPQPVRLRPGAVRLVVGGGALLVAGALTWAFVVQPELRQQARMREIDARDANGAGAVRPAEAVVGQPATYDRLPPPRMVSPGGEDEPPAQAAVPAASPAVEHDRPDRPAPPSGPSTAELAARAGLFFAQAGAAQAEAPVSRAGSAAAPSATTSASATHNPRRLEAPVSPYELKAGTLAPAVLLTAVDTSRSGPVVAAVTENVFDTVTGRHLLLPQGTRLIGRSEGASAHGDDRAFLTWERLILPNGKSLVLDGEAAVDGQGATGLPGRVDRRLGSLAVATLFGAAVTTLGQAARDRRGGGGGWNDAGDAAAIQGAQVGGRLVDRELGVRPVIRLDPGAPVRVLITRDLVLEPYDGLSAR